MAEASKHPIFDLPEVLDNLSGWGPVGNMDQFQELPYQQFNKADKIGKVADWIGISQFNDRYRRGDRYGNQYASGTVGSQYDYVHDEEESTFQLVDTSKPQRSGMQRGGRMRQQQQFYKRLLQKENERRNQAAYGQNQKIKRSIAKEQQKAFKQWQRRGGGARGRGRGQGYGRWGDNRNQKQLAASIAVRPEWQVLEEMDFPRLVKLNLPNVEAGRDINGHRYGQLYYYEKSFDRVTVRHERPLQRCGGTFYNMTTTEDPVIQKLAQENAGNVFATDMILATLMAATRSVYSWDVIAYRVGDKLFFDKRDTGGFSNPVDALTVSETSTDAPQSDDPTSINHPRNLATEALYINQNFRRMVLRRNEDPYKFDHPQLPFDESETDTDSCVAYKYRSWSLGQADGKEVRLVCRTEHDGVVVGPNGDTQTLTIKAFNEWDSRLSSGVDWRSKLDTQKGAVLATELQNNSCKLAKWTLQALLAGSDQIKFGYVSRANVRNSANHVILGTQQYKPTEFATNITLNLDNAWGILRCIIDNCMKQPPGKYLLLKDPNKQAVRLYSLPEGTFESSEEDDSDSSGDDGSDDDN